MAFSTNFDKHVRDVLNEKAPEYEWKQGWPLPGQRGRVDVAGCPRGKGGRLVLIEVELKRVGPIANIAKVWRWARGSKNRDRILFVQAFSGLFKKRKNKATDWGRAVFVGERMSEDKTGKIAYKCVQMKYTPKKVPGFRTKRGGGRMVRAARLLAGRVAKLVHSA